MTLDPDSCYRAVTSRDARFEGSFFVAVRTTKIYCRPGCPAPLPMKKNVTFYVCAAAAEEAGFRPCKRCRPDAVAGSPAWVGASTTVSRALRLIAEGALDAGDVEALASRLGVGARHLRRLFAEHLGAAPVTITVTRRVHFARRLLDETSLSMTAIAESAGFASIRRFNHAFRATFGAPPSAVRARKRSVGDRPIELSIPVRAPYDAEAMFAFLGVRATPGVEEIVGRIYRRTATMGGAVGLVEAELDEASRRLRIRSSSELAPHLLHVVERLARLFDAAADPRVIAAHLRRDTRLARLVAARPGIRVPGAWDGFEIAVRAVLGQQVSVAGATTLAGRIAQTYGAPVEIAGAPSLTRLFPTPAVLAEATELGIPRVRAEALRALAAAVRDGVVAFDGTRSTEDVVRALTSIRGIGPWTAAYVAMRALGEPDALPAGDLVIQKALGVARAKDVEAAAEAWRPWRAYAVMHLWTNGGGR